MRSTHTTAPRRPALLLCRALVCALLAVPAAGAEEPPPAPLVWHDISDPSEGFAASFPAEPTRTTLTFKTLLGSIEATKYYVHVRGALFAVERHPLPRLRFFAPSSLILDQAKKGVLNDRDAEQISYTEPEGSEHPQRVLVYRTRDSAFEAEEVRLHLRGRSLYLVTAETAQGEQDHATARRFLDSFRLLEPEDGG
jgi:hypothetical protein